VIARLEAGPCDQWLNSRATFSDDIQMRVGKQLLAGKRPNQERGRVTAQTRFNLLFLLGLMKGGDVQ
jgi:hypothetical protein